MKIPVLALLLRSVRVDARSIPVHLVRLLLVGVIFIALYGAYETSRWMGAPGLVFFGSVVWINFALITLSGLSHFATSISEEKDERTLGLLRMTRLNPVAILLGKSSSRMLSALMMLIAQLPFTILSISLGGVAIEQVFDAYLALGAYIVLLANAGLLSSVIARHSRAAVTFMVGFTVLFHGAGGIFALLAEVFRTRKELHLNLMEMAEIAWSLTPGSRLFEITSGATSSPLGLQFYSNIIAGLAFFLMAWAVFEHFNPGKNEVSRQSRGVLPRPWRKSRSDRVWRYPLVWKDFRQLVGGVPGLLIRTVIYAAAITIQFSVDDWTSSSSRNLGSVMMGWAYAFTIIELVLLAPRFFRAEIRGQTLSALVMLPRPLLATVAGKLVGCLTALLPALTLFCIGAYLNPRELWRNVGELLSESGGVLALIYIVFFIQLTAYLSLWMKWGAVVGAVAISLLGWITIFFFANIMFRSGGVEFDVYLNMISGLLLLLCAGLFAHTGVRLKTLAAR